MKVAGPEQNDFENDLVPRVPSSAPPDGRVSSDEICDRFDLLDSPSLYSWRRYQALQAFPQRHTQVNMDNDLTLDRAVLGLYSEERL